MKKLKVVRYFRDGWYHAALLKSGRKWAIVRDLYESTRIRNGVVVREKRRRRVPMKDVEDALWQ